MKKILLTMSAIIITFASMATKHIVTVQNFQFTPNNMNVNVGDTIRWVWVGGSHTTTCDPAISSATSLPSGAATWSAPMNGSNMVFEYKVTVAGSYHYHCLPHGPGMAGDFVAQAACVPPGITSASADEDPICTNATTTLTANGVTGTNATVAWFLNGNNVGVGTTLPNVGVGTYTAIVSACNTTAQASVTVNSEVNTWTGGSGNNWNSAGNWSCGVVPAAGDDVDIPVIPSQPFLTTAVTVGNLSFDNVLHLNGQSFTVNGTVTGNGAFSGSSTSSLTLNGNAGTLHFIAADAILKSMQLNTGASAHVAGNLIIMGP